MYLGTFMRFLFKVITKNNDPTKIYSMHIERSSSMSLEAKLFNLQFPIITQI